MSTRAAAAPQQSTTAITEQVREHYDGLSWLYRAFWGDYLHHGLFSVTDDPHEAQLALLDYCVRLLPIMQVRRFLDAGCGYGTTTIHLARRFRCVGEGVSISPRQIAYARQLAERARLDSRVTFTATDVTKYDYPNPPYDLIWAMESTEHFADKRHFFNSAAHALAPGGMILVAAWTAGPKASPQELSRLADASVCAGFVSTTAYEELMTGAGLMPVITHDITDDVARTWDIVESRVRWLRPLQFVLPRAARQFSRAIPLIRNAFRTGLLTYNVMTAHKPRLSLVK